MRAPGLSQFGDLPSGGFDGERPAEVHRSRTNRTFDRDLDRALGLADETVERERDRAATLALC